MDARAALRHRPDFLYVEDAQVRLPLVELVQPIMARAEVCRWGVAPRRLVEHATQPRAIDGTAEIPAIGFQTEADVRALPGVTIIEAADVAPALRPACTRSHARQLSATCTALLSLKRSTPRRSERRSGPVVYV